jgi:putative redox protein
LAKPPSRVIVNWVGGCRFDAGRADRPLIRIDTSAETGPGPVDTLMCSLAACTAEDVLSYLDKRRTPAASLRVDAEGIRADAVPARVVSIQLTYHVEGEGIDREHAERSIALAVERYCSVRSSLDPAIPVKFNLVLNGAQS